MFELKWNFIIASSIIIYLATCRQCAHGFRDSCYTLQVPDGMKYDSKHLKGHDYANSKEGSVASCARKCKSQKLCKSFNFHKSDFECFLNRESHETFPSDMKKDSAILYYIARDWPDEVGGQCTYHTCSEEEICKGRSTSSPPYYECITNPHYCLWELGCSTCVPHNVSEIYMLENGGSQVPIHVNYQPVTCLGTNSSRSNFSTLINLRSEIDWFNLDATIMKCAALAKNSSYSYFGIEFYGECWMTNLNLATIFQPVLKHRCDSICRLGVGAQNTVFFYKLA